MKQRRSTKSEPRNRASACVHHWVIESPAGPTSKAKCKRCGTATEFMNYVPFVSSHDGASLDPRRIRVSDA